MAFDLEHWKAGLKRQLRGWKKRLQKAGVDSVYYYIAAVAFLPVVQAVHAGGDWGALAVLGGAVGSNLLAGMVQKLKDRSDGEIAAELEKAARVEPILRQETAGLLEKLDVLQEAGSALPESDRAWFARAIREELQRLGSCVKFEVLHLGGGAIAQDGSNAIGARGVWMGRDADDNVSITGNVPGTVEIHQPPKVPKPLPLDEATGKYLDHLIAANQHLCLQGIRAGSQPLSVALEKVYVSLTAMDKRATGAKEEKTSPKEFVYPYNPADGR